jgi:hypothetical protein
MHDTRAERELLEAGRLGVRDDYSSAAVGWISFAGAMLVMVGIFQAIAGIVAIADDEFFVVGRDWTFKLDTTAWGWIHLGLGVILVLAGIGVFSGNVLARTIGVGVALLSAVANFLWLPYYPVWSIVMIAVDISIIWALTAHGRDITIH